MFRLAPKENHKPYQRTAASTASFQVGRRALDSPRRAPDTLHSRSKALQLLLSPGDTPTARRDHCGIPKGYTTMKQNRAFRVNQPSVASELIDGEVVIMNLDSGNYYSTRQIGGQLWSWIEEGVSQGELVSRLMVDYAGEAGPMASAVETFIGTLLEHELIVEASPSPARIQSPPAAAATLSALERPPFTPPVLEVFADMRDLLLLDPIHDVAEVGWPTAKPSRPAAN